MMLQFLRVITLVLSIIINGNLVFMSHGFYYGSSYCDTNGVSSFNRSCVGDYGLPIQSPFWISSGFVNPDGHGGCKAYPGFEVSCEVTKSVMNISNHRYNVRRIDSNSQRITLVDVDIDREGCPRPRHNFSLQSQPFLNYDSSERLTIFYNCTIAPPPTTGIVVEIPCLENSYNTRRSYAFLPDYYNYKNRRSYAFQTNYDSKSAYAVPEGFHDWYKYCDESVGVPVDYHSNFTINATAALQKPFSLRWTLPLDCDDCVRRGSGGQCSANDTTGVGFRCQCKDGTTVENRICPDPRGGQCKDTTGGGFRCQCKNGTTLENRICPDPQGQEKKSSINIVAIVVPAVIAAVLLSIVTIFFCLRRKKGFVIVEDVDQISNVESLQLKLTTVAAATENFSEANKLGEGGFGPVYKGKLSDGQEIAVKRLSRNSGQGVAEFKNEILLLAKLQHRNLVRLLGFCLEGEEKLLIYEFVINASLDQFIFDPIKRTQLDWGKRYNIIGGIARGLLYLHEDSQVRIIHRDLKASNILLNDQMNPKISDFGTARLFMMDQTHANTRRIAGTFGYMPPEYVIHGHFSVKSDVFSFGVLVLELISGKKNTSLFETECADDLLCYAWRRWREGTALELLDPVLRDHYNENEVTRCIHIGLLCVQEDVAKRPTMATVVLMLSSYSVNLALPSPPPRYGSFTISGSMPHSNNEVSVTELSAR